MMFANNNHYRISHGFFDFLNLDVVSYIGLSIY